MTTESPDLRPFRERVLELIAIVSPGSGMKPASEVLNRLRERIGSWVDERLRLYERTSAEVEELRAERVKLQDENAALRAEIASLTRQALTPEYKEALARYTSKPSDIEALAERLAKAESSLATALLEGARDRVRLDEFETRVIGLLDAHSTDIAALKFPDGEKQDGDAFPAGAATTVEEVLEATQTSDGHPLRGDRVRLEGVRSIGNTKLEDRWYDVTGATEQDFQVEAGLGRFWVPADDPGVKEVRRGAAKLPE